MLAMPAGAEEPGGLGEEAAEPETSSSALVFDAKGVARPVTSYEAAETAASREKQDTAKAKDKDKNKIRMVRKKRQQTTGFQQKTPCMSPLTACAITIPPATWMPWAKW